MHKNLKSFLLAMQLLTRIPVSSQFDHHGDDYKELCGRSVLSYPLVGLIIGSILALSGMIFSHFFTGHYSVFIVAVLILVIWVLITGGLHLDGLADSADGWLGGFGDPVRTLEIMKDPRSGAAGVVALVLLLLFKFVLITAVLSQRENAGLLFLIIAPVLARASIPALFLYTPYARKGGMGSIPAEYMSNGAVKIVLILLMLICLFTIKNGFYILLGMGIFFYLLRRMMIRRIGGMTGDTAGAMVEIMECTVLLFAVMEF
jgi:adenosylcobinamide-GDP ribazoletransferase